MLLNDKSNTLSFQIVYTKGDSRTPRGYYKVYSFYELGCADDFLPWGLNPKNLILKAGRFSRKKLNELKNKFN